MMARRGEDGRREFRRCAITPLRGWPRSQAGRSSVAHRCPASLTGIRKQDGLDSLDPRLEARKALIESRLRECYHRPSFRKLLPAFALTSIHLRIQQRHSLEYAIEFAVSRFRKNLEVSFELSVVHARPCSCVRL
jgi:hypothetical protein